MGLKSNCQHLKSTPIKTLPRYRFGFVIVVSAVLSITRSGKKAWLYLSLCIRWPNESEQELRSNYEQWGKIVIRKKRRWGKWAQRQMLFWTCVRRLVAMCLNTRGACKKPKRRWRWRKKDREGDKEGKRCHLLSWACPHMLMEWGCRWRGLRREAKDIMCSSARSLKLCYQCTQLHSNLISLCSAAPSLVEMLFALL